MPGLLEVLGDLEADSAGAADDEIEAVVWVRHCDLCPVGGWLCRLGNESS